MKKYILFLFVLFTCNLVQAQSLKDMLYSGKLKKDSNLVIRKGDDLSSRIDTATKKEAPPVVQEKPVKVAEPTGTAVTVEEKSGEEKAMEVTAPVSAAAITKNNNDVWKDYVDSLLTTVKTEVLSSKKIKKETYYLYVDYEIDVTGQVNILNVVSSPANDFLQDQIRQRMLLGAPQLQPVLDANGKPRKIKRKYNFTVTKD